jgi:Domain of unknown function (DUF3846)
MAARTGGEMSKIHTTNVVKKIYADGTVEEGEWKMTLEEMQKFVGGWIEMVPSVIARRSLIINEEGLLKDLPPNTEATSLTSPFVLMSPGGIRGNALLIKSK